MNIYSQWLKNEKSPLALKSDEQKAGLSNEKSLPARLDKATAERAGRQVHVAENGKVFARPPKPRFKCVLTLAQKEFKSFPAH